MLSNSEMQPTKCLQVEHKAIQSVPKVLSLKDNRPFLDSWLTAVEPVVIDSLYPNWRELYFEFYDLASESCIFDGRQECVVIGRMLVLLIVSKLSKLGLDISYLMQLCGVPEKLYPACKTCLFGFMRYIFDFPLHCQDDFDFTAKFRPHGSNSYIYFATPKINITNHEEVVFKALPNEVDGALDYSAFVEIFAHYKLWKKYGKQPNLSELVGFYASRNHIFLVFPRYPYTFEMFTTSTRVDSVSVKNIFRQLCDAIEKLHDLGIAHRDIKLENIMFDANWNLVLIDFGLCSLSYSSKRQTFPVCTITTRAPEQLFYEKEKDSLDFDGKKIDIWSLGCMLSAFGMKSFEYIFPGTTEEVLKESVIEITSNFEEYITSYMWKTLGVKGVKLMRRILNKIPDLRPTISEILSDDYFCTENYAETCENVNSNNKRCINEVVSNCSKK